MHETKNRGDIEDEQYIPQIAVLSSDALGIDSLLRADDGALSAANALEGMLGQIISSHLAYEEPNRGSNSLQIFQYGLYFGDSVYVFTDPSEPLEGQVNKLTALAAAILWVGAYTTLKEKRKAYAPRIGIALGDLRVRTIQVEGRRYNLRIGRSMALAHKIEWNQNWVGGALPSSLVQSDEQHTAEYDIPIKDAYKGPPLAAINWLPIAALNEDRYPPDEMVSDLASYAETLTDSDAKAKWTNTWAFAEAMLRRTES